MVQINESSSVVGGFGSFTEKKDSGFDAFSGILGSDRILTEIKSKVPVSFNGRIVVNCDPANSKEVVCALTKLVLASDSIPIIVLLNYNYRTMIDALSVAQIKKGFIIIDTVSKSISLVSDSAEVIFVDSIRNLTQLQIKMINLIDKYKKVSFIFDSLSILSLYHGEDVILKFISSITKIMHKSNSSGFFVCAGKCSSSLGQFFDEEVVLKKYI